MVSTRREPLILCYPMAALKPQTKTELVKCFIFDAGSSLVSVEFIKLDGSVRKLQFNPRDTQEIKGTGHALKKTSIIRCRDFAEAMVPFMEAMSPTTQEDN